MTRVREARVRAQDSEALGQLTEELRHRGMEAGLAAVGIAPATPMEKTRRVIEERKAAGLSGGMQFTFRNPARSTHPARALPGAAALVVGAWPYAHAAGKQRGAGRPDYGGEGDTTPRGRVARYAWRDHYATLRVALRAIAAALREEGWRALVLADDNGLVDRAAAERAGLGWFGKNANILLPGRGSWFVLGSVVTDAPLPPDPAGPMGEGCGSCRRCLSACPTGALVGPGVLDARRCLAWLLQAPGVFPWEYRAALGDRIYGCDDCQEVCPANRLGSRLGGDPLAARESDDNTVVERDVDVLAILEATDAELLARYGRWYIARRDPRYLRRNALIVLGNVGNGRSPAVEMALRRYLSDPDELLRAHAVWAATRAGRPDLVPAASLDPVGESSDLVRDELARLPEVTPAQRSLEGAVRRD